MSASGFPLPGGPAHRAPEVLPNIKYSAWALQPHEQGREHFHLLVSIGKSASENKGIHVCIDIGILNAVPVVSGLLPNPRESQGISGCSRWIAAGNAGFTAVYKSLSQFYCRAAFKSFVGALVDLLAERDEK